MPTLGTPDQQLFVKLPFTAFLRNVFTDVLASHVVGLSISSFLSH